MESFFLFSCRVLHSYDKFLKVANSALLNCLSRNLEALKGDFVSPNWDKKVIFYVFPVQLQIIRSRHSFIYLFKDLCTAFNQQPTLQALKSINHYTIKIVPSTSISQILAGLIREGVGHVTTLEVFRGQREGKENPPLS